MSTRSEFLASSLSAATACAIPEFPAVLVQPRMLRPGDLVGLVAPASPLSAAEVEQGIAHMRSLGLRVQLGAYVRAHTGYLAGTDRERAEDLNRMARDPHIRAIVALRGGYGTMRMLNHVDYTALRRDPKIVLGFSDITALLNAITMRSGIVTFHGPLAVRDTVYDATTRARFTRTLMQPEPVGVLHAFSDASNASTYNAPHTIAPGHVRGRLAGGNLSIIAALAGTPYAIPTRNAILFLEETQEDDYRIDRMLTQLRLAGTLQSTRGIIVGQLTDCPGAASVLFDRLGDLNCPTASGFPFGHIGHQWILPIGTKAAFDASNHALTLLEAGVRPL